MEVSTSGYPLACGLLQLSIVSPLTSSARMLRHNYERRISAQRLDAEHVRNTPTIDRWANSGADPGRGRSFMLR